VKTPPSASIRLGASVVYRGVVVLLAAVLIAAYALFHWPTGSFVFNFGTPAVLMALYAMAAIAWAVWDAWRPRRGALHYAAGEWVLALGDVESQGTIRVEVDLQNYLLVRFMPQRPVSSLNEIHSTAAQQLSTHPQWLHLENRHGQDWLALRRALFAAPPLATHFAADARLGTPMDAPQLKPS
jgi:hypothetical protein